MLHFFQASADSALAPPTSCTSDEPAEKREAGSELSVRHAVHIYGLDAGTVVLPQVSQNESNRHVHRQFDIVRPRGHFAVLNGFFN